MKIPFIRKNKKIESTKFSRFIRNASSSEKKKIYTKVMQKAIQDQANIVAAVK